MSAVRKNNITMKKKSKQPMYESIAYTVSVTAHSKFKARQIYCTLHIFDSNNEKKKIKQATTKKHRSTHTD